MAFRLEEATKARCMRRNRGDERLRFLVIGFFATFFLGVDCALLADDWAATGAAADRKLLHHTGNTRTETRTRTH